MDNNTIHSSQLPSNLEDKFWPYIINYSVGLLGVNDGRDDDHQVELIGSGTFVESHGRFGILTASHVIQSPVYRNMSSLGLLFIDTSEQRMTIDRNNLTEIEIGRYLPSQVGPDIAMILLSTPDLTTLRAMKGFWNIDSYISGFQRENLNGGYLQSQIGRWTVCGIVDELASRKPSERGFRSAIHWGIPRISSNIKNEWEDNGYDYLDFYVPYDSELPKSFGGTSGGGLWQIPISLSNTGAPQCHIPIYSGVAFFQSNLDDGSRLIRCHGRKSIYEITSKHLAEI